MSNLQRWRIEEAPSKRDPERLRLLLKGALTDVHALIRRFGTICGRPKKTKDDPQFNYALFLNKPDSSTLGDLRGELKRIAGDEDGGGAPAAAAAPEIEIGAPGEQAQSGGMPEIQVGPPAGGPEIQVGPPAEQSAAAAPEIQVGPPAAAPEAPAPAPEVPAPAPAPEAPAPAQEPPVPAAEAAPPDPSDGGATIDLTAGGAAAADQPPITLSKPGGEAPPPPGVGAAPPAAAPPTSRPNPLEQELCGAGKKLDPLYNLDDMETGGFNRFAHAALMSVMSSPGTMYNPLFIAGPGGSGKTHMLHALAHKLQAQAPDQPVLMTSGSRLAQAATLAAQSGKGGAFEAFAQKSRALIIDDLHLLGVNDQNRELLSKLIAAYYAGGKQVLLASIYGQNLLGGIEQAVGLNLGAGHSVELKKPGDGPMKEIVGKVLERAAVDPSDAKEMFVDRVIGDFPRLETHVRRLRRLTALRKGASPRDLVSAVLEPDGQPQAVAVEDLKAGLPPQPAAGGEVSAVIVAPVGGETHGDYGWHQAAGAAQKNSWTFPFASPARKTYAVEPVYGAPFAVAAEAYTSGARAALVIGPPPGCELAQHEGDFMYAVEHLLKDWGIACAYMPHGRLREEKVHLMAYLDMLEGAE